MRRRSAKWLSGLGAMVLGGGLVVANYGTGVPQAGAQTAPPNPLTVILEKLDQVLTALGGIREGNHTLRWDTNNPSASRFVTAFTGAVLDKNTGLVWEQAPDGSSFDWNQARFHCVNKNVGGTRGWRLPAVAELASLSDPSLPAPLVPASVFTGVQSAGYWSATTIAEAPTIAWVVSFDNGGVGNGFKTSRGSLAWCVRGGSNAEAY